MRLSKSCRLGAWACTLVWSALVLNPLIVTILADDGFLPAAAEVDDLEEESPFMIVIDGGSTGSRLHVFEFVEITSASNDDKEESTTTTSTTELDCIRRGSARANYPLSAFGRTTTKDQQQLPLNATLVAEHMLPAFVYAAEQVPSRYHASTAVYYQATAGMRLLDPPEQEAVYDALYQGLLESPAFQFTGLKRANIATLSGEAEGFYGAVAANFLKGTIDVNLQMIPTTTTTTTTTGSTENNNNNPLMQSHHHDADHDFLEASVAAAHQQEDHDNHQHHHHHGPIGALDMGGSSTQIVFLPGQQQQQHRAQDRSDQRSCRAASSAPSGSGSSDWTTVDTPTSAASVMGDDTTCHAASPEEMPLRLNGQDFFATSYLSYGVDQFRERLWTTWVNEHKAQVEADQACDAMVLENPCTFKGYELEWEGYTLIGTGDAHLCVQEVQRLIPHPEEPDHDDYNLGSHVGGVEHPPVRGKFFAMSLYFFTLDSLRELSHPDKEAYEALNLSWPTPSIAELYNALDGLCSRSWEGDLEDIQHNAHAFTRAEVLPHRCLESVYMVTLLRDGYGFAPESRDITFTFLVDGSEVEWSLGMALAYRAQQHDTALSSENLHAQEHHPEQQPVAAATPNTDPDRSNATREQCDGTADSASTDQAPSSSSSRSNRLIDALSEHLLTFVA